ncbi:MAG: YopT-type cysteine protease domain-containing protein [Pseudomonadota bacterium]
MPIFVDKLIHSYVSAQVEVVRNSLPQNVGAMCTQAFSQCRPPVVNAITASKETSGGICHALSAMWIKHHLQSNQSLGDWLCPSGRIDMDVLFVAETLQGVGIGIRRKTGLVGDNQDSLTDDWLKQFGIVEDGIFSDIDFVNESDLANRIVSTTGGENRLIAIGGKLAAHTMAANATAGGGVLFFDPNYGEFQFPDSPTFTNWFAQQFWPKSKYSLVMTGSYRVTKYRVAA